MTKRKLMTQSVSLMSKGSSTWAGRLVDHRPVLAIVDQLTAARPEDESLEGQALAVAAAATETEV